MKQATMKRSTATLVCAAAFLLAAGCATTRPLPSLAPSTAENAWHELQKFRDEFRGAAGYTRMRVASGTSHRSFNARLSIGGAGAVELAALTPLGTTAFTLFVERDEVLFLNHLQRTFWNGTLADLNRSLPIFGGIEDSSSLGFLLVGLPPPCQSGERANEPAGSSILTCGGYQLTIDPAGLRSATRADNSLSIEYAVPAFPTGKVLLRSSAPGGGEVSIEYLELNARSKALRRPAVPSDFTRGAPPVALETGS
ncbi:MAG: DUF4292 domain-containing protein [Acidobacteriota bacterium]